MEDTSPSPELKSAKQEEDRIMAIHAVKSFVLALVIVVAAILLMIVLVLTKEDPKKKADVELIASVRVEPIVVGSHQVVIETQGVVNSLHEVQLSAEVAGRVIWKSESLVEGAVVTKEQSLLNLDSVNYLAVAARASAAVADAELALSEEQAMSEQAAIDWKKLGRGEPTDLVLRKPQLKAAQKRLKSAEVELLRATEDVKRTSIRAPFDARVRRVQVELGSVLAPGAVIAELYSPDKLEVRLPFSLLDYGFLEKDEPVKLVLTATVGGEEKSWPAELVRIDGEVQRSTLSAYGFASIKANEDGEFPQVGLFVEAKVPGKKLENVVVLPRSAVRGSDEVWVVQDGRMAKRKVTVVRAGDEALVVKGEFLPGDKLVLTRLAAPLVGMKVEAVSKEAEDPENP